MSTEMLLRYIHFISIFTIVGTLSSEYILLKKEMTRSEITRLSRIDAIYGLAALTLLIAGSTLWLGSHGKPAVYYARNWVFHVKLSLFLLIGLLSIYPTVFFIKHRKGEQHETIKIPQRVYWMLRLELLLLVMIPFLAGLMSRGIGYF
jgi:putative membrane protein